MKSAHIEQLAAAIKAASPCVSHRKAVVASRLPIALPPPPPSPPRHHQAAARRPGQGPRRRRRRSRAHGCAGEEREWRRECRILRRARRFPPPHPARSVSSGGARLLRARLLSRSSVSLAAHVRPPLRPSPSPPTPSPSWTRRCRAPLAWRRAPSSLRRRTSPRTRTCAAPCAATGRAGARRARRWWASCRARWSAPSTPTTRWARCWGCAGR